LPPRPGPPRDVLSVQPLVEPWTANDVGLGAGDLDEEKNTFFIPEAGDPAVDQEVRYRRIELDVDAPRNVEVRDGARAPHSFAPLRVRHILGEAVEFVFRIDRRAWPGSAAPK